MQIVTRKGEGLFPSPREISLSCSCPDWATMCKHVAATLYGVGARLDRAHRGVGLCSERAVDAARLHALREHLAEPCRVVDTFSVLFGRRVPAGHQVLATGEAIAHLNYLLAEGDAVAEADADGVRWYRRV